MDRVSLATLPGTDHQGVSQGFCISQTMSPRRFLQSSLPPLLLISSLFAVYLRTMAPGLTWANAGSDGGDLIAAAATGGVAHPGGYPLYLLLARLFQFIPVGAVAFRTNLLSALASVSAS